MPTRRAFNTGLLAMLGSTALAGCAATGSSDVSRGGPARITAIDMHAHVFERGLHQHTVRHAVRVELRPRPCSRR